MGSEKAPAVIPGKFWNMLLIIIVLMIIALVLQSLALKRRFTAPPHRPAFGTGKTGGPYGGNIRKAMVLA
jgi:hypothetical protein